MDREEQARRNREAMPNVAAILDEFREVFGPDCKLLYGKDRVTGHEVGTPSPRGVEPIITPRKDDEDLRRTDRKTTRRTKGYGR